MDHRPGGLTSLLREYGVSGTGSPTTDFGDGWYALGINTGNSKDFQETVLASGHSVGAVSPGGDGFPQFQLLAGAGPAAGHAVAVGQGQVESLLPRAIAACDRESSARTRGDSE